MINRRSLTQTVPVAVFSLSLTACRMPDPEEPLEFITRKKWAPINKPIPVNATRMGTITRITVHHDGIEQPTGPVTYEQVQERLLAIRQYHLNRGWADIGYHFIVDSSGRVWQGRPLRLQGAHVSGDNEGNIGILMLGNFQQQHPSDRALAALSRLIRDLKQHYQIRADRVYTHKELSGRTQCPGDHLQAVIDTIR